MASVNKVIIVGHLGADPETRYLPSSNAVTSIRVATSERQKDKQTGDFREVTEWHSISFFNKLAEIASQYLRKGSLVYVEGSLRTRKYTDKNGVEKLAVTIMADQLRMLGGRESNAPGKPANTPAPSQPKPSASASGFNDMDDDIPF